jgi:predicted RNA-binding protein with PUA-like domain
VLQPLEMRMTYWLVKSEPGTWSWNDQVKKGAKGDAWSGVRNFQARANLMRMKKGDRAFFYHSGEEKAVVGVVEIVREHYPDPTAKKDEGWVVVDVKAAEPMKTPVTLAAIKAEPKLKAMVLVRNSRLSVQPVTAEEWKLVCKIGGMK